MPDSQTQTVERPATLELDDGARLGGQLSALPGNRLQLSSIRLIRKAADGSEPALQTGATATLKMPPLDPGESRPPPCPVAIEAVSSGVLSLRFQNPEEDSARQCVKLLAKSPTATPRPGPRPVPTAGPQPAATPAATPGQAPQDILRTLRSHSLAQMERLLKPFLADLANYLFDLSTQVRHSSSDQNIFYDATVAIRRNAAAITAAVIKQLDALYDQPLPQKQDDYMLPRDVQNRDQLNLVDTAEFESSLALDRMITAGEEAYHIQLEALIIRMAELLGANPKKLRLPVHVRHLSKAFQQVITAQKYPGPVLLKIFDFFTRQFMHELDDYYTQLNRDLAASGIRPGLEQEIESKGSLLQNDFEARKARTAAQPAARPDQKPPPAAAPGPGKAAANKEATLAEIARNIAGQQNRASEQGGAARPSKYDDIYKSVIDALNFRRSAEQPPGASGQPGSAAPVGGGWDGSALGAGEVGQQQLAGSRDIARVLDGLQRNAEVRAAVEQGSSLREYLASNKENLEQLKETAGLTADSLNQLDLVDNLFGTIRAQLDVTADLKPALGDLHIPLAKLALMDQRFFLDRNHPARTTLDKLAQLANSANFPNKALEGRIAGIVEDIVENYEEDAAVFEMALRKIESLAAQQERALSRNVERVVRIQEGQDKLHRAQQLVDRAIAERIGTANTPRVLVDLMDNGWRDLLVLTHVREGPDSDAWKELLKTLDQLNLWLSQHEQGEAGDDLLMQRGLEAGTLIDMIGQQLATALPTNVSHQPVLEELREIVAGNREVELVDRSSTSEPVPEPAEIRARIEDLPRLRRWVKRVEQLEKDSWLTYRDKEGRKVRIQLAWISEEHDRFIFVNERGQKIADLSAIQLARQLSKGMQPPAPADRLSVVDKSLYETLEHVQKTLSFSRNHDSLTRLINRDTFVDQVQRAVRHARARHSQHAVLYLNVDQFALVNEVYDRVHGDQVLLEFARLLAQLHGKKSSSARLESDSFAVLLLDRDLEQAMHVAEKIRHDIEASSVDIEGENISFTVSIGVAPVREYSPDVGTILESARTAMHHAKEQGRNRVVPFIEDQTAASTYTREKQRVKKDLEQAVATDRFVLQAQPIVQTRISGDAVESLHYELLLGISNKDGTLASPSSFIASAERYGFMTLVDRWVVREAFRWISQLMDAQKVIPSLSINLSGMSVTDDDFMDYLFEQISEYGVGTSRVCFEITETGTISNLVKAADFVRAFRNIGCKFSIDDFGTGLASHNYLRELPVDYVKIDGSFVVDIHNSRNDYAIARSINDLAHFLGQETIAESVENDQIVDKLREIGVDYLQGWGVGRPKLLAEVAQNLSTIEK
jgi:diguanylate cyclase (GGDEF)-like protein